MPRRPTVYGEMLREDLSKHGGSCWLVNTGWSGGSVADGAERMKIRYTRAMLRAALDGKLMRPLSILTIALGSVFQTLVPISFRNFTTEKGLV